MSARWDLEDKARRFDCVEVQDSDGELEGFTLIRRRRPTGWYDVEAPQEQDQVRLGDPAITNPVSCCRTCSWAGLEAAR